MSKKNEIAKNLTFAAGGTALAAQRAVNTTSEAVRRMHPAFLAVAGGVVGGALVAPLLVNGNEVHDDSLYSRMFKRNQ